MEDKFTTITNEITYRLQTVEWLEAQEKERELTGDEVNLLIWHKEEIGNLREEQKQLERRCDV